MATTYGKGVAHFKIDNVPYSNSCEGGFTIAIRDDEFEPIRASDGQVYFSSKPALSEISGKILVLPGFNPEPLTSATNVQITVVMQTGTYGLRNAVYTGSAEIGTDSGEFDIKFTGIGFKN